MDISINILIKELNQCKRKIRCFDSVARVNDSKELLLLFAKYNFKVSDLKPKYFNYSVRHRSYMVRVQKHSLSLGIA